MSKTTGDALRDVIEAIDALKDEVVLATRNDLLRMMTKLTYMALDEDTRPKGTNVVKPHNPPGWYRDQRCDSCGSKLIFVRSTWTCPIGCEE